MATDFASLDKAEQRSRLLMEFGRFLAPLDTLAEMKDPPPITEYRLAFAKADGGTVALFIHLMAFTTFSDITFASELSQMNNLIHAPVGGVRNSLSSGANNLSHLQLQLRSQLEFFKKSFVSILTSIPIDWQPILHDANTPFTTHLRITDAIAVVRTRLDYLDRYLKEDFFQLYLRHIDRSVAVSLVTTKGQATLKNSYGVAGVHTISDLCRKEFSNYQLLEVSPQDMHGRSLRVDNQVFTLDTGTSDAGKYPTHFGPGDSSPAGHQVLDNIIAKGAVVHHS